MTNRVATVFGAAFLGCLVSAPSIGLAAPPEAPAADAGADACLSGPKGAAPKGERWYYRVERGTKRHCWYTRAQTPGNVATKRPATPAEDTDSAMADAPDTPPPATSPPNRTPTASTPTPQPAPPAPLQPVVANARAELARANSAAAPSPSPFPPPPVISAPSAQPAAGMPQPAATPDLPQADPSPQPSDTMATAAPPPAVAATTPPARGESTPLWVLLSVIGGVLAMVGIVTALIRMVAGSAQYHRRDTNRAASRWEREPFEAPPAANADPEPQAAIVDDAPVMNWVRIARENAGQPDEEIEQLLSRRARPAA